MDSPDITVVVTTKDRQASLGRALASVLRQQGPRLEVVVVDDGSAVAPTLPDDDRVRLVRHAVSRGVNAARNTGLAHARGTYITYLDDDDELAAGALQLAAERLDVEDRSQVALVGTVTTVDEATGDMKDHVPHPIARGSDWLAVPQFAGYHAHNSLVLSTDLLRSIGGFDPDIRSWTHDEMFVRLTTRASIIAVRQPMYFMYENSARPSVRKQYRTRAEGILRTLRAHDAVHGPVAEVTADRLASVAWHLAMAGDRPASRHYFIEAFKAAPFRRRTLARLVYALGGDRAYRATRPILAAIPALSDRARPVDHETSSTRQQPMAEGPP